MDEILSVMKMVDAVVVGCRCCIGMVNGVGYIIYCYLLVMEVDGLLME